MIVISNGMLRSGSTLQYNVAACVLETGGPLRRVGFLGDFGKPEIRAKLEALKAADGWTILKTHEAPLERGFYDDRVRVLFSYRDVRDIAASIKKKWGHPFVRILSDIDAMIEIERAFHEIPNVLVQSYGTLYGDLTAATLEIGQFLNVELSKADAARIANDNTVAGRTEAHAGSPGLVRGLVNRLTRRTYDARTLLHPDHISATGGKDGDWKSQFTEAEISKLSDRFGDWLKEHGYERSIAKDT